MTTQFLQYHRPRNTLVCTTVFSANYIYQWTLETEVKSFTPKTYWFVYAGIDVVNSPEQPITQKSASSKLKLLIYVPE